MHITIAQRLIPFSHEPGTFFILPGTTLRLQVFPTLIKITDLAQNQELGKVAFSFEGPLEKFTAAQDLERGVIKVWGDTKKGFIRYRIAAQGSGISITSEKGPIQFTLDWAGVTENTQTAEMPQVSRLSLGSHKALDWQLLNRRKEMSEIFPLWHKLGQLIPYSTNEKVGGLLDDCRIAVEKGERLNVLSAFHELYLAGFDRGLSPRAQDTDFQGLAKSPIENGSPLALLTVGAQLIQSLFIRSESNQIHVLPLLPPEFHCGRLLHVNCGSMGEINLEWSKKLIRRVVFKAKQTAVVNFQFQKEIQSYRLRNSSQILKGKSNQPIEFQTGEIYWFDNFEK